MWGVLLSMNNWSSSSSWMWSFDGLRLHRCDYLVFIEHLEQADLKDTIWDYPALEPTTTVRPGHSLSLSSWKKIFIFMIIMVNNTISYIIIIIFGIIRHKSTRAHHHGHGQAWPFLVTIGEISLSLSLSRQQYHRVCLFLITITFGIDCNPP